MNQQTKKPIGVIGSGNMGRALGVRLAKLGYPVFFGARRLEQAEAAAARAGAQPESQARAQAGSVDAAAAFGELLIWTMRETDPAKVLADPALLNGKTVIDLNNRNFADDVRGGAWFEASIAGALQVNAPEARVVKAFNTLAMTVFDTDPAALAAAGAQTFLAGADPDAKAETAGLAEAMGLGAVDLGDGEAAFRAAEALGDVVRLLILDQGHGGQAHLGFSLLPEPDLGEIGGYEASSYR
ncbi:MAG: NAD(P)-binding domain-containing protein [Pseudomonadota bacterium]